MTEYDHYNEAKTLISTLRDTPCADYADALQAAIDGGSTGTEIFLALRWNLEHLIDEENLDPAIRRRAIQLRDELDSALQ